MVEEEGFLLVFRVFFGGEESHLFTVVAEADAGVVAFVFADAVPGDLVGREAKNSGRPTAVLCRLVSNDNRYIAGKLVGFYTFQVETVLVRKIANEEPVCVFVQAFLQAIGQGRGGGVGVAAAPAFANFEAVDVGNQEGPCIL